MYLYNSLTHKKELFVPNDPDLVKMYTCGPTVYHYAHIGNLRTYIMEDVLEKSLRYLGYNVKRVMNLTAGQQERNGISQPVNDSMNLCGFSASACSDKLVIF